MLSNITILKVISKIFSKILKKFLFELMIATVANAKTPNLKWNKELSKEITMFHQKGMIQTVGYNGKNPIDVIGFHGITLWHKPADRYTHQIGDAKLLKNVIAK